MVFFHVSTYTSPHSMLIISSSYPLFVLEEIPSTQRSVKFHTVVSQHRFMMDFVDWVVFLVQKFPKTLVSVREI